MREEGPYEDPDGHHGPGHRRGGDPYRGAGQGAQTGGARCGYRVQRGRLCAGDHRRRHPALPGTHAPAEPGGHGPGPQDPAGDHPKGGPGCGPRPRPDPRLPVRGAVPPDGLPLCHHRPLGVRHPGAPALPHRLGGADGGGVRGHQGLPDPGVRPATGAHLGDHQRHRHGEVLPRGVRGAGDPGIRSGQRETHIVLCEPDGRGPGSGGRPAHPDCPGAGPGHPGHPASHRRGRQRL